MRILFLVQSLGKGGAERLILDICNELNNRQGIEHLIISFSKQNDYPTLSKQVNYVVCNSSVQLSLLKTNKIDIDAYLKIVQDFKPDVIHSNVYKTELISREYLFPEVKYFTHCHNNMPEFKRFSLKTFFNKRLLTNYFEKLRIEKQYKKCNNQFITISQDTLQYYKENLSKYLTDSIRYLPNAINYTRFYNDEIRILGERINLVMTGHMSDNKNQTFLIDVLEQLRNRGANAYLKLIGDWRNNGEKIEKKAKERNLSEYLSMPGLVEDVETQLKEADIYVHSSYSESFGLVIIEAMAAGLPVVSLDSGGNKDIILQGKNGFLINQDVNVLDNFVKAVLELIQNPQLYQEMSKFSKVFAKDYDIKAYVDKLIGLYKN